MLCIWLYCEFAEARRLLYVAITRAKKDLWIINAKKRMLYGQTQVNVPSRFIDEIDDKYIETENNTTSLFGKITKFNKEKMFTNANVDYNKGDIIRHEDYGEGTITEVDKRIITVEFPRLGTKKFIKKKKTKGADTLNCPKLCGQYKNRPNGRKY